MIWIVGSCVLGSFWRGATHACSSCSLSQRHEAVAENYFGWNENNTSYALVAAAAVKLVDVFVCVHHITPGHVDGAGRSALMRSRCYY